MPEAKRALGLDEEAEGEAPESDEPLETDLDALRTRADVEGTLKLAKAYRSGAAPGGRDLKRCFEAYRAAAELGSADAEYAVALFCMTGGVVPQDLKDGATRLRAAAERGSIPAKVYLGNLYELGIHYKADPEKADVWYRNAARGARISAEVGTDAFARELAELGCVRYVLALVESGAASGDDKARLLQRARAHGYALTGPPGPRRRDDATADRPTFLDALQKAEATPLASTANTPVSVRTTAAASGGGKPGERQRATTTPDVPKALADARTAKSEAPAAKGSSSPGSPGLTRGSLALGAFGYALLFVVTGIGAGYAATLGARELVVHGQSLPGLGTRTHLVFPIVLGVVGVLPTWLVYRFASVLKALVVGAAIGGIGWVAWGTGQASLSPQRPVQALVFAIGGFLAGLCVLGFLGGTKKQARKR
jgi:hypothetical protein